MGGGDLNLKKSWHPMLMSNQKRVWEEEQKALAERKKIDQMMKERAEERSLQELQDLQESAGGKKRQQRVDWMYSGPSSGQAGTTEEMEGYLLGKRRVDGLLKGSDNQKLEKAAKEESFMAVQNANTLRDTAAKIRDDPMLAIKKQEQAAYEAMMNDPVKRRLLLKAAGKDDTEREHKRRKHSHHHHHHRHRDDRDRSRRHTHRDRYDDSDEGDRELSRRSRRRRSPSRSDSGSRSPRPRSHRSPSPRRKRSYSPDGYNRNRRRSRSPYRSNGNGDTLRKSRSWHESRSHRPHNTPPPPREKNDDDAGARLAAMQQDASDLDEQRQRRLQSIAEREKVENERLDAERARNAKYGGRATFVDNMNRRAGDISLGDRIGRSGQSKVRDDE